VSGQLYAVASLPHGKESLASIAYELGWFLEPVWMVWNKGKCLAPAGNRTPTVLPVVCHFTD
jgi:hypothetical protein